MDDEDGEKQHDTLFVRNVARGVNEEELGELFGDIGPVKECFLVVEKNGPKKGTSKGYGFVKFALADDCSEALSKLSGHVLNGKPLLLEKAGRRGYKPTKESKKKEQKKIKRDDIFSRLASQATVVGEEDSGSVQKKEELLRSCSVVLFGIPATATESQLKKKAAKVGKVNAVEFPLTSFQLSRKSSGEDELSDAIVIYTKPENAAKAISRLSGIKWGKNEIQARRIKQIATTKKSKSRCRLIIRNLAFTFSEKDLREAFSSFGPITDIVVSTNEEKKNQNKGFAFVQYACRADAVKALNSLNGKNLGKRPIAVDFAVDSNSYKKQLTAKSGVSSLSNESTAKENGSTLDDKTPNSLPDTDTKELQSDEDDGSAASDASDENNESMESKSKAENEDTKDKNALTLFVRNLSFENTEYDVYNHFRQYGGVKYAKLVKDNETKRSKGCAFVQYYRPTGYERALAAASATPLVSAREERLKQKLRKNIMVSGKGGTGIFLNGRPLVVCPAIDKYEAKVRTEQGENKVRIDKRHLYLAREGMVHANPVLAQKIPKLDLNKRIHSEAERKTKLKSPLFFVSPTRLSVRNINRNEKTEESDKDGDFVTEYILKTEFRKAAELGMKKGVVGDKEGDPFLFPIGWPKNRSKFTKPKVLQCRLLREESKDLTGGKGKNSGRPKGYGFVEFSEHVYALAALRVLNNNPAYAHLAFGGKKAMKRPENTRSRLIVEFAVENAAKVREQKRKRDMIKRRQQLEANRAQVEYEDDQTKKHRKKRKK